MHKRFTFVLLAVLALTGIALGKSVVVRVNARNYQELYDHVTFKGTSIDIAGTVAGKSYDLVMNERDVSLVKACGLETEVIIPDLEYWQTLSGGFGSYRSYTEHIALLRNWASLYSNIARLESIGPSYEGRWIYGLRITNNPSVEDTVKPEMLLYGQIHAREWAGAEMIRYTIDTLLRNYMGNMQFQTWINNHQLWVFPILNVDGFTYDYPGQLSYRKNRQPFGGSTGTDLNRDGNGACQGAANTEWGSLVSGSRTSHMPSDDVFMGATGAFAPEVKAITGLFKKRTFAIDVSIHSYSELVLWPWGVNTTPPDNSFMTTLGQRAAAQIGGISGGTYTPQQSVQLYPTNGGVEDWFYGWARTVGGFACPSYTFEVGTTFYQPTSNLDQMQPQVFKGIWMAMQHVDSSKNQLHGTVPRPAIAAIETSLDGDYNVHWTPIRPARNTPDKWELEELQNLSVVTDDIEANTNNWTLQGAASSTTQKHSGTKSIFLGNTSNMSNWAVTKDPYPVTSATDSVKFWTWYNLESNYDVGMVEVSLEGKEWFQLDNRWTGNSSGWVRKAYSLAPWLGKSVFIRFHACSDDGTNNGGMYVDDIYPVPVFGTRTTISNTITDTMYAFTGKPDGRYYYRVRGHNTWWNWGDQSWLSDVQVGATGVVEERLPSEYGFAPARTEITGMAPNPFADRVTVDYAVARQGPVNLSVYNTSGRLVRTVASGTQRPGTYSATWDGRDGSGRQVANGVYVARLAADRTASGRILLLH